MSEKRKCLAVIRIRGIPNASPDVRRTLSMLHLNRTSHATLIDNRPEYAGMLQTVQHYVTWGEISKNAIAALLEEKGRLVGDKKLTDEYLQKLGYKSVDDLAEALYKVEVEYKSLHDVKPVFRLHPPSKGYEGKTKKSFKTGGAGGYRGVAINHLLKRMV